MKYSEVSSFSPSFCLALAVAIVLQFNGQLKYFIDFERTLNEVAEIQLNRFVYTIDPYNSVIIK